MSRILIIDDMDEARTTIRKMLERNGYEVTEATNGKIGVEKVKQEEFDLVITDIIMPDMEGLETIQQILHVKSRMPIIAITASMDTPYLQIALKLGAVHGLYKPFKQAELLDTIKQVLKQSVQ